MLSRFHSGVRCRCKGSAKAWHPTRYTNNLGEGDAMTQADWEACDDPDPMVRVLAADRYQRQLRLFAVACARRIWSLLADACRAALEASEGFANSRIAESELAAAVAAADQEAQ